MPMAEISVVVTGKGTSLSRYVAEAVKVIRRSGLRHQLTPMGSIIESDDLGSILKVIEAIHEKLADMGCERIISTIKIDDRLDKPSKMEDKVTSVMRKLTEIESKKEG